MAEFAAAEFGARIGRSPAAARELIGDALDLRHRFPQVWARVEKLEVRVSYARYVAKQCRDLDAKQAGYVDGRVVESADGRIPWTRFQDLVTGTDAQTDWAGQLPRVQLYVHTYRHADGTGVARIEGHGPVTEDYLRRVLGPRARFRVTPVLDVEGQAPVDAYEIPDRHRHAVHLITPADVFPYASSTSRGMEVDHTSPYEPTGPPGQSRIGTTGP